MGTPQQTYVYPTGDGIRRRYLLHVKFMFFVPRSGPLLAMMDFSVAMDERYNCSIPDHERGYCVEIVVRVLALL